MSASQLLSRLFSPPTTILGWGAAVLLLTSSCNAEDVGAPCNHGQVEPPESKLVTFPALTCNDLLCVYADESTAPTEDCGTTQDCNLNPDAGNKFECIIEEGEARGECKLGIEYVLERSMCSKKCETNDDCLDGGPTQKVVDDRTQCARGFECARIQTLGKFCCQKLCVCRDDLGDTSMIDAKCIAGTQEGCCKDVEVPSEACGGS